MTQDDQKPRSLGLSAAQVTGSALAAMSGAFLASWLGTTGTLIGAAVGSIIATVGSAIYAHSLRRTSAAVKRTASQVRATSLLTGAIPRPDPGAAQDGPVPDPSAPRPGQPDEQQPASAPSAETPTPKPGRLARLRERIRLGSRDLPWLKVAAASVAVLVVALAGITLVESLTGRPLASLVGKSDSTGTTVGNTVRDDRPLVEPTPPPADDVAPTAEPDSEDGSDPAPDPVDPVDPVDPAPTPSSEPVPSEAPDPDQPAETDEPDPAQP